MGQAPLDWLPGWTGIQNQLILLINLFPIRGPRATDLFASDTTILLYLSLLNHTTSYIFQPEYHEC